MSSVAQSHLVGSFAQAPVSGASRAARHRRWRSIFPSRPRGRGLGASNAIALTSSVKNWRVVAICDRMQEVILSLVF